MVCKKRVESIFEMPSCDQVETTKKQIGENRERMEIQVENVRQFVRNRFDVDLQPHIVRNYLRGAKHDPEKAKRKLENYIECHERTPEIFTDRNPMSEDLQKIMKSVNLVFLPKLTENGDRVSVFSLADKNPSNFDPIPLAKVLFMIMDLIMTTESPVSGEILIFDAAGVSTQHVLKLLQPVLARALFTTLRSAYCIRVKTIHIVNAPPALRKGLALIRPMCHEKVRGRFVLHDDDDSLRRFVPAELLPSDLGGHLDSTVSLMSKWQDVIEANGDWFRQQEEKFANHSRRKGGKFESGLGVEGTFRKLAID